MPDLPQRWLSLSGICSVLNATPGDIKRLYNQKLLVRIGNKTTSYRYLDPTPEYAERLRFAAVLLTKLSTESTIDLNHSFVLTGKEVAELMGWSWQHAQKILRESKIPRYKAPNRMIYFSVQSVRSLLWKRQGRKLGEKRSPFLMPELIAYAQRLIASETALVPTDEQVKADAEIQKKMEWMLRQPQREVMLADFLSKMDLAKRVLVVGRSPSDKAS